MPSTESDDGHLGREVIFEWGGKEIPGVRQKAIALAGEGIDTTSDENDGWRTLLADSGVNTVEITISGVTKSRALKNDWFKGTRTKVVVLEYPDGHTLSGTFRLASFTDTGPYNEAMTFEATLQSTGPVTLTPYT